MSPDDNNNLSDIADYYASQGMSNPQLSYDANGNPIYTTGATGTGLPVDVSNLKDYAATLPSAASNPLPTHEAYTPPATQDAYNALTGANGVDRFQLFPERIARSALSLPADVMSGKVMTPSTMRSSGSEEDFSSDPLLQRVQDMAALMGGGGVAMAEKGALGTAGGKLVQPATDTAIAPVFHSAVENAVNTASMKSASPQQWLSTISNSKGVKPEELDWTGLKDWLGEQSGPVSKEQVQGYLQQNKVGLGEVNKGPSVPVKKPYEQWLKENFTGIDNQQARDLYKEQIEPSSDNTKYSKYQLPGGENYREKLLTLPTDTGALKIVKNKDNMFNIVDDKGNIQKLGSMNGIFGSEATALQVLKSETGMGKEIYKSSHWDEPNILAHIRMNDRNVEGKDALHIEEIQSDWHQQGREHGYKTTPEQKAELETIDQKLMNGLQEKDIGNPDMDAVLKTAIDKKVITPAEAANYKQYSKGENSTIPDAPFKKTWLDLALKRVIREAAESGKDRISWTPGEAQAARYDLSKSIDKIDVAPRTDTRTNDRTRVVQANMVGGRKIELGVDKDGNVDNVSYGGGFPEGNFDGKHLSDIFGKEVAEKIMAKDRQTLSGLDLKVGGEGMHYFYDKMLPQALEKLTGQKMKVGSVSTGEKGSVFEGPPGQFRVRTGSGSSRYYDTREEAEAKLKQPINYIDLPQSVKDTALHKGFPLFSSGLMLNPVQDDPFKRSGFKLTPVKEAPKFK